MKKEQPNGSCFFFGDFPLCGCGEPQKALEWTKAVLTAISNEVRFADLLKVIGGEDGVHWLALYALGHAKLIEHGGNILGSWLTSKGKAALAYLDKFGTNDEAWDYETKIEWEE